jgi:hypothetical protein
VGDDHQADGQRHHGRIAIVVCSNERPATPARQDLPIGGRSKQIIGLRTTAGPEWIGSMPGGRRSAPGSGPGIAVAVVASSKQPKNRIGSLARSRNGRACGEKASPRGGDVGADARGRQHPAEDRCRGDEKEHRAGRFEASA